MAGLPNPTKLPRFQRVDEDGTTRPVTRPGASDPREITDYVLDPADFPGGETTTADSVLRGRAASQMRCEVCGMTSGGGCPGRPCVEHFQRVTAAEGRAACEIREAGGGGGMGLGVFAARDMAPGAVLGEYLGRLYPAGGPSPAAGADRYVFIIPGAGAAVSARDYGNHLRFVNHHCEPNVAAVARVCGGRQVIVYRVAAAGGVRAGEQLFVSYGATYFTRASPCRCGARAGDHLPGRDGPSLR